MALLVSLLALAAAIDVDNGRWRSMRPMDIDNSSCGHRCWSQRDREGPLPQPEREREATARERERPLLLVAGRCHWLLSKLERERDAPVEGGEREAAVAVRAGERE